MLKRVKNAKYCLNNAKSQLYYARKFLNDSISINGMSFKGEKIDSINNGMQDQINAIDYKIIPKIEKM